MAQLDITKVSPSYWRVSFDNPPVNAALAEMKAWVDAITLPDEREFPPQAEAFAARLGTPRVQSWVGGAFPAGLQQPGDLEANLGTRSVEF